VPWRCRRSWTDGYSAALARARDTGDAPGPADALELPERNGGDGVRCLMRERADEQPRGGGQRHERETHLSSPPRIGGLEP